MAPNSPPRTWKPSKPRRLIVLLILASILAAILLLPLINTLVVQSLNHIHGHGAMGAAAFCLLCITSIVLFIPPSPLKLGAGAIFGFTFGAPLAWFSVIVGSTLSFLLGRNLARKRVEQKVRSSPTLQAVDQAVTQSGWKIVALARLCPIMPCPLLNYAFGISNIPLHHYIAATALGNLPSAILYTWIGSAAGSLSGMHGASPSIPAPWNWIVYTTGTLTGIFLTAHLTKMAHRILKDHLPQNPPGVGLNQ